MTGAIAALRRNRANRDLYAGMLLFCFGLVAAVEGRRLGSGTLADLGPGYVPLLLGLALCGLGLLILVMAIVVGPQTDGEAAPGPEWRGWFCILAGAVSFVVLGIATGLVLATFFSVLIAAFGDRTATVRSSLLLAGGVTVFGVLLFHFALKISIPLFQGWN